MNKLELKLGLYDDPKHQLQDHYTVDLYSSNLAVFGAPMTGKKTLVKTLLVQLHQTAPPDSREEVYIMDFGGNLAAYGALPYVAACFDAFDEENIRRMFRLMEKKLEANRLALPGRLYAECGADRPPHVTFLLEGLTALYAEDRYAPYQEILQKLARDGLAKGISVVFTANEPVGGITKLLSCGFRSVIAFDLQKDSYSALFSGHVEKPAAVKGRGLAKRQEAAFEFQGYLPCNPHRETEAQLLQRLCGDPARRAVPKLKCLSGDLTAANWAGYTQAPFSVPGRLTAGLEYYNLRPVTLELKTARSIAIYGKRESGKTNLLKLILTAAQQIPGARFVFWEDGRNRLRDVLPLFAQQPPVLRSAEAFVQYLFDNGYYETPRNALMEQAPLLVEMPPAVPLPDGLALPDGVLPPAPVPEPAPRFCRRDNPFTVFVIQSRQFYQTVSGGDGRQTICRLAPFIDTAADNNALFVFSDVQNIPDATARAAFNGLVLHAFLMNDIARFVQDKGQNSVFGAQDVKELRESFGGCGRADGFYFDIEADELLKLKFIKAEEKEDPHGEPERL